MLAGGELDVGERFLQLDVAVNVVGVEHLFPPVDLDACLLACLQALNVDHTVSERLTLTRAIVYG